VGEVLLGKNLKRSNVLRTNDCEVAAVQGRDGTDTKPFGERDYRCIDCPEGKIVIPTDQLRDAHPVAGEHRLCEKISRREISEEANLCLPTKPCFDEIRDFGNDQLRNQQRTGMRLEKTQTLFMIAVILVDVGVERPGIDDQRRDRRVS
jgi:hypothetical protein